MAQATLSWPSANSPCLGRGPTPRGAALKSPPHHELRCAIGFVNGTSTHHRTTAPRFVSGCGKQGSVCNMARAGRRTDGRWFVVGEATEERFTPSDATHDPPAKAGGPEPKGFRRTFGDFGAEAKVTRAGARNILCAFERAFATFLTGEKLRAYQEKVRISQ